MIFFFNFLEIFAYNISGMGTCLFFCFYICRRELQVHAGGYSYSHYIYLFLDFKITHNPHQNKSSKQLLTGFRWCQDEVWTLFFSVRLTLIWKDQLRNLISADWHMLSRWSRSLLQSFGNIWIFICSPVFHATFFRSHALMILYGVYLWASTWLTWTH